MSLGGDGERLGEDVRKRGRAYLVDGHPGRRL